MGYKNPEDQAAAAKRHYEANKKKIIKRSKERNKKQRERNRSYVRDIKQGSCCVDCGEINNIVLEFDHIKGKKFKDISSMVNESYSIKSIQKEIDKCELRCANCHRIITHARRCKNIG